MTSARAAAICPSRPATAFVPCTKCTGMFASRENASTWSSKSAGLAAAIAISSGRALPVASNSRIQRNASITSCCGLAHENRIGWAPLGGSTRISAFVSRHQLGTCRGPAIQETGTTSLNSRRRGRQHGDISLWPWISTGPKHNLGIADPSAGEVHKLLRTFHRWRQPAQHLRFESPYCLQSRMRFVG